MSNLRKLEPQTRDQKQRDLESCEQNIAFFDQQIAEFERKREKLRGRASRLRAELDAK